MRTQLARHEDVELVRRVESILERHHAPAATATTTTTATTAAACGRPAAAAAAAAAADRSDRPLMEADALRRRVRVERAELRDAATPGTVDWHARDHMVVRRVQGLGGEGPTGW